MPGCRFCALYRPLLLVVAVRTSPVALFWITRLTPATRASDWSSTCTDKVAPANWARAGKLHALSATVTSVARPNTTDCLKTPLPDMGLPLLFDKLHAIN